MVDLNGTLIAQIINFLILTAILAVVAYKPLLQILADRQANIAEKLAASEHEKIQAEQYKQEYEAQLALAHTQAQAIVEEATKLAEQTKDQILTETRTANAQMLQAALDEIARERTVAMAQLKNEVANLSIVTAAKIVGHELDPKLNAQMVTKIIDKLDEKKTGNLPC
ncbi:F0F1 ATP synthase subunit B [Sporomusa acidovorans]|uniref:ATP synthase subunit b n=1 Tax=Sporomusa acidovorans (strain ATCC 49682 / DSM 3132 / Mol) TaxID=1123286 RepID=A0ABZ3J4K0_SPOA4|nr:F0F1 ATP synthase subunit B [Sporomusa acidovorans]OZC16350.1 ATP synthase subunit b precursor [Sporomusa acidovorans DSM 3132]SDF01214.1 ATP synthase F0 subcomplex B subunit [Sporomusa acidovorans]